MRVRKFLSTGEATLAEEWFVAQTEQFFLVGLKKLEHLSYKCVELRGNMYSKYIFSVPWHVIFFIKPNNYQTPPPFVIIYFIHNFIISFYGR
jgi:hypothetical protein